VDSKYAPVAALWRRQCPQGDLIYTTNAVESLNMSLCKALKPCVAFPSEEATLKVMYFARSNVIHNWEKVREWRVALNCFTLQWEDRIRAASEMWPSFLRSG
jgi:transposase-like protein